MENSKNLINYIDESRQNGQLEMSLSNDLKNQVYVLLKSFVFRWTKGKNSSVEIVIAEKILKSILYVLEFYINNSEMDKITILKRYKIEDIYNKGYENLVKYFEETQIFFHEVIKDRLLIENLSYNTTLDKDIPEFFTNYDIFFQSSEVLCGMDYPILFDNIELEGIVYIRQYIEKLHYENHFCNNFSLNDIENLLKLHGQIYKVDFREIPFNICEVLLNNAIFSYFISKKSGSLLLSASQAKDLQNELLNLHKNRNLINNFLERIFSEFIDVYQLDKELKNYILQYKDQFIIKNSEKFLNNLRGMFLVNQDNNYQDNNYQENRTIYNKGKKMNNELFRFIIENINKRKNIIEKINIIKSNISSLEDFIDILKTNCFFGEEYFELFKNLSAIEIALLTNIVIIEEVPNKKFNLKNAINIKIKSDNWNDYLIKYLNLLSNTQLYEIEKNMKNLA